jgi:hypothetical protein
MSHYWLNVCLPAEASADVLAAIDAALAPFSEATTVEWDQGYMFDTWRISDPDYDGGFWVVPGHEDDPRLFHIDPRWENGYQARPLGRCRGGPRGLLDLDESPAKARMLAGQTWDIWHRVVPDRPTVVPFAMVQARLQQERDSKDWYDHDVISAEFEAQPALRAFRAEHPHGDRDSGGFFADVLFDHMQLTFWHGGTTREAYIESHARRLAGAGGLLTLDGWWIELDGAANHGPCGSGCDHRPTAFDEARRNHGIRTGIVRYLEALPPDALILEIEGHC